MKRPAGGSRSPRRAPGRALGRAPGRVARRLSTPPQERRRAAPVPPEPHPTSVESFVQRAADDARSVRADAIELAGSERNHRRMFEPEAYAAVSLPRSAVLGPPARYRAHGLTALPVESNRFGVAVCTDVLDRVTEPRSVLGELNRALLPDGRLYLTSPLVIGRRSAGGLGPTRLGLNYLLETTGFSLDDLQAVLDSGDYAIVARKSRPSSFGGFTRRR